jgi:hypothetical protein
MRGIISPRVQMKSPVIALLVFFASNPAVGQVQVKGVEVLDYGIYTVDVK